MAETRKRCLIIFVAIALVLLLFLGTGAYLFYRHRTEKLRPPVQVEVARENVSFDSCPRPKQLASNYDFVYTNKQKEFQNLNSSVDYFRLLLSWSPTFCAGKKSFSQNYFQCQQPFGFVVHGLWPNTAVKQVGYRKHPRNCRDEPMLSADLIQQYFCLMPSEVLMQAEWEKHGTCHWQKADDYFKQIKTLRSQIQVPDNMEELLAFNGTTLTRRGRRDGIKNAFLKVNPQIKPESIDVIISKGQKLREIAFCYNLQFNYTSCTNPTNLII